MKNNTAVRVSCIMPTYNTADFIGAAIQSVLAQTYQDFELVIVNDGSTDNTHEIVSSFRDPRIKYFELDRNRGRGYVRNFAVEKCQGEFVAICDADDISLPNRLEKQVCFFDRHPHLDVVSAQLLHFSGASEPRRVYNFPETTEGVADFFRRGRMGVAHASCMLRKSCFREQRYEEEISYNVEDFELFLRLAKRFKMASLPDALVLYRNNFQAVTFEKVKLHHLYHNYALYSAQAKMQGRSRQPFEAWSAGEKHRLLFHGNASMRFAKVKMKQWLQKFD